MYVLRVKDTDLYIYVDKYKTTDLQNCTTFPKLRNAKSMRTRIGNNVIDGDLHKRWLISRFGISDWNQVVIVEAELHITNEPKRMIVEKI